MNASSPHSGSLINADYWWYVARAGLLDATFGDSIPDGGVVVDIGSADGPSVGWLDRYARRVPLDAEPSGGALAAAGFTTERVTYAFAATFPFLAADRLKERVLSVPATRVSSRSLPPTGGAAAADAVAENRLAVRTARLI